MIKSILKLFIPSPKKLSNMAAEKIQTAVNQSGKEDLIAKYASMADSATEIQKWVTEMLVDGKIDDMEKSEISDKLEPLLQKIIEII